MPIPIFDVFKFKEVIPEKITIELQDAEQVLRHYMEEFSDASGIQMRWLDAYQKIAEWLENNQGLGLLMFGDCGQGKTLMARYIIPAIFLQERGKVFHFVNMTDILTADDLKAAKSHKLLALDDVGVEGPVNDYGTKLWAFEQIMDAAEKQGKLVVITTNLNGDQLRERYGERTMDRILATTKRVCLTGQSNRR